MNFKYKWWGKGDLDATFGIFFDGFSKILTATGIMILVFGMPADLVIGKMVPAIGLAIFLGNLWYFYEARHLAHSEKRQNVTAQPFGIGASQLSGWLYLIMGPIYWQTGDAMHAFRVGLAAAFLGGLIEILGGLFSRVIVKYVPNSALLGNMASSAFVWLSIVGMVMVFDKPIYAVLPLFIIIIDYLGKADKRFKKVPSGIIAIVIGTAIAWGTKQMSLTALVDSFDQMGFYMPNLFIKEIFKGFGDIVPYLPIIIPLQINNFLSTLQGIESAKQVGDVYPERRCMVMDGVSTLVGSLFGNPFPTTIYFGHPGWKELDARAGFTLANAILYLIIGLTGLTGVIMQIIPVEAVMVLLIFVGFSVTANTFRSMDKKYHVVLLVSLVPIIIQYVQSVMDSAVQAAGTTVAEISAAQFAEFSVAVTGIQILGNGAFLSSLLIAAVLACVIDKHYLRGAFFSALLAISSCIGLIHSPTISWLPTNGVILGAVYLVVAGLLVHKHFLTRGVLTEVSEAPKEPETQAQEMVQQQ